VTAGAFQLPPRQRRADRHAREAALGATLRARGAAVACVPFGEVRDPMLCHYSGLVASHIRSISPATVPVLRRNRSSCRAVHPCPGRRHEAAAWRRAVAQAPPSEDRPPGVLATPLDQEDRHEQPPPLFARRRRQAAAPGRPRHVTPHSVGSARTSIFPSARQGIQYLVPRRQVEPT
jgi:hypothetical protein